MNIFVPHSAGGMPLCTEPDGIQIIKQVPSVNVEGNTLPHLTEFNDFFLHPAWLSGNKDKYPPISLFISSLVFFLSLLC